MHAGNNHLWTRLIGGVCFGLSLMAGTAVTAGPAPELRKVHALLVIDTLSGLGGSVELDGERLERLLRNNLPPERAEIRVLTGKDVEADGILAYYQNLKATSDDALFFYYAGHGATDSTKGHFLAVHELKAKPLLRADLLQSMQQHRPGLVVIMTDCCSNRFKLPGKFRRVYEEEGTAKTLQPLLRCLLYQSRGVVDITAASGDVAFGDDHDGGIFTRSFDKLVRSGTSLLDADHDGFVSWQEFFPRLQAETKGAFVTWALHQRAMGETVERKSQKPYAYELGAGSRVAAVQLRNQTAETMEYQYRWGVEASWESAHIAPGGVVQHVPPVGRGSPASPLEVRYKGNKTAELQVGKMYRFHDTEKSRDREKSAPPLP
jgi:hypothetical protein